MDITVYIIRKRIDRLDRYFPWTTKPHGEEIVYTQHGVPPQRLVNVIDACDRNAGRRRVDLIRDISRSLV